MPTCRIYACTCRRAKAIWTSRRPGLDALLVFAERAAWPADMQVYELASERIGPVLSPRFAVLNTCVSPSVGTAGATPLHTRQRRKPGPVGHGNTASNPVR